MRDPQRTGIDRVVAQRDDSSFLEVNLPGQILWINTGHSHFQETGIVPLSYTYQSQSSVDLSLWMLKGFTPTIQSHLCFHL